MARRKATQSKPCGPVGMTDGMRFEYLHHAAAIQYGLVWIHVNQRMRDGAADLIDPIANKWLLSVLAYKACQYFNPKEPHHLTILSRLNSLSDYALESKRHAGGGSYFADEAVNAATRAAHYGRLVMKALDLLRDEE